jgi:hypothetical protein
MALSLFLLIFSQEFVFLKQNMQLQIDCDASSGGQGKLTHVMYFSSYPPEAAVSIYVLFLYM